MTKKPNLREQLASMSERELTEHVAFTHAQNEKHLASIRSSLNWILGLVLLTLIVYFIFSVMAASAIRRY